jgi:hypothetical protein
MYYTPEIINIIVNYTNNVPEPREVSFRSQQDFRRQVIGGLLAKGRGSEISLKRRILKISQAAD